MQPKDCSDSLCERVIGAAIVLHSHIRVPSSVFSVTSVVATVFAPLSSTFTRSARPSTDSDVLPLVWQHTITARGGLSTTEATEITETRRPEHAVRE